MLKLTLEAKQKTLKELDDQILVLIPDEELDTEIQQADECQENTFEALVPYPRICVKMCVSCSTYIGKPQFAEPV